VLISGQLLHPMALFGCLRNRQPARQANSLQSGFSRYTGHHKRTARNKGGTADSLAAMDGDLLTFLQGLHQISQDCAGLYLRRRNSAIGNWKTHEAESIRHYHFSLLLQLEGFVFCGFQERHYNMDSGPFPTLNFILQPIASARTGGYGQAAAPGAGNPE